MSGVLAGLAEVADTEVKFSQVEDQMKELQINAEHLEQEVNYLRNKLYSVLLPATPKIEKDSASKPSPPLVPLAQEIAYLTTQIRGSLYKLRDLSASVELTARTPPTTSSFS